MVRERIQQQQLCLTPQGNRSVSFEFSRCSHSERIGTSTASGEPETTQEQGLDTCCYTPRSGLHVMQSTVSARIHALEQQLGCTPFVRDKAGTTLTPAGRQFQKHASTLVRTVEHARHDVGVPRGFREALTIGGRFGLWEQLLLRWLPPMREITPGHLVRLQGAPEF